MSQPERGSRSALALAETFLESAIVSGIPDDSAERAASACDSAGLADAGRLIREAAEAYRMSAPRGVELAALALRYVRTTSALLADASPSGEELVRLGTVAVDETAYSLPVAAMAARRAGLAALAPEARFERARRMITAEPRSMRRDGAWALKDIHTTAAARLLVSNQLGREGSESLRGFPEELLFQLASDPDVVGSPPAQARIASALIASDKIESLLEIIETIGGAVFEAALTTVRPSSGHPDVGRNRAALAVGIGWISLVMRDPSDSDTFENFISWARLQPAEISRSVGEFVATIPGEYEVAERLFDIWSESDEECVATILEGISPPGFPTCLVEHGTRRSMELAAAMGSFEARLSLVSVAPEKMGSCDRALSMLEEPAAVDLLLESAARSGPSGAGLDGLIRLGEWALPSLERAMARDGAEGVIARIAAQRIAALVAPRMPAEGLGEHESPGVAETFAIARPEEQENILKSLIRSKSVELIAKLAANGSVAALRALAEIDDPRARRAEEILLVSEHEEIARISADIVARRGSEGYRYAEELAASDAPELQEAGLRIIARADLDTGRGVIVRLLRSGDPWVVRAAIEAAARAGAGSMDKDLARRVISSIGNAVGGAFAGIPALASIGEPHAIEQAERLNDHGHLFAEGRDDQLFRSLLEEGERIRSEVEAEFELRKAELLSDWEAEGRLVDLEPRRSRRRTSRLLRRSRGRR